MRNLREGTSGQIPFWELSGMPDFITNGLTSSRSNEPQVKTKTEKSDDRLAGRKEKEKGLSKPFFSPTYEVARLCLAYSHPSL